MKTSQKNSNPIIVMFWSMPSCTMLKSYKVKSDKLVQAIKEDKQVEVVTQGNNILRLKKLGMKPGSSLVWLT